MTRNARVELSVCACFMGYEAGAKAGFAASDVELDVRRLTVGQAMAQLDGHSLESALATHNKMELYDVVGVNGSNAVIARDVLRRAIARKWPSVLRDLATHHLDDHKPHYSARDTRRGAVVLCVVTIIAISVTFTFWAYAVYVAVVLTSTLFLTSTLIRAWALFNRQPVSSSHVQALKTITQWPRYTVLVPLFKETDVLDQLLRALSDLDYPHEQLDIKLLIEESDDAMRKALAMLKLEPHFSVLVVPDGKPRTKPRALNYGLLFAHGQLLTIFDGEDIPGRLQLKQAALALLQGPPELACVQAKLALYNCNENWLTRQFAMEYAVLFGALVPVISRACLPVLLGGTSNHFRVAALNKVGGWDPYNVTEDADLGLRLARKGFQVGTVNATTFEECVATPWAWQKQRARWLKGFLQSFIVHTRSWRNLMRDIGGAGAWIAIVTSFGVWLNALCHPFLVIWCGYAIFTAETSRQFDLAVLSGVLLIANYVIVTMLGRREMYRTYGMAWISTLVTFPLYMLLSWPAAIWALWQLLVNPHHWSKTQHGVSKIFKNR
jgi:glycosyltransferase XagB